MLSIIYTNVLELILYILYCIYGWIQKMNVKGLQVALNK